jgi:hypothetical protein
MWRKREVEQLIMLEAQREMEAYLSRLLNDTELDIEQVRYMFEEQYPGEEQFFDNFLGDFLE